MKFVRPSGLLALKMNSRSTHMYCAPTVELRFANFGMLRIGRRLHRARADVAEAAGHADAVRPHQVLAVVVARVGVVALGVPGLGRLLVEVRVREQAQADDAGARSRRRSRPAASCRRRAACRARRSRRPDTCSRSRTDRRGQSLLRTSSQRPQRSWSGPVALLEARLVDQAEVAPAVVARVAEAGMRADRSSAGRRRRRCSRSSGPRSGRCRRSRPATCCGP